LRQGRLERALFNVVRGAITAACVDDLSRRIIFGTHEGEVKVFNIGSGSFMKVS
jgi:hypothetical protein